MTVSGSPKAKPAPPEEPGLEPPDSIDADPVDHRLQEDLFQSLVESADYTDGRTTLPARSGGALQLATPEAIRKAFTEQWDALSHSLGLGVDAEKALLGVHDLVMYDIPDGTRSTLSVPVNYDVDADAGLYCLALVHTLASLGARTNVILTHTVYNRERGPEDTKRFLDILAKGIDPFREYARRHGLAIHLEGIRPGYELEGVFRRAFPAPAQTKFHAHFLMDYEEEWFLTADGRALLEALPPIDVVVRHTKLGISGGWIPIRMRKATYVYSQNGTVHSNWNFNEYAAMVAIVYLAKLLHQGEALSKKYASIDEIKARYRDREIKLRQKIVHLTPKPRKLFVLGSPVGLIQVYA
ncbi:MAG: hypothetical protein E6K08_09345 [Methanobacteriota archaeon]|nr:MAG: hypothetical protein E6K08_09345 [Euryarchaeota archaeon]